MIAHAGHDENGRYSGGAAGDQTGSECCIQKWYNRPWTVILRAKKLPVRDKIAKFMEDAAKNDCIGYDQSQRTTLYNEAKKVNFNASKISTKCECDCSSLVACAVIASGINISKDAYTGNLKKLLLATGEFNDMYSQTYRSNDKCLLRGDILLNEGHHVAVNLTDGPDIQVYVQGWKKDNIDVSGRTHAWWYALKTRYYYNEWADIDGYRYHFDENGYIDIGLKTIDGKIWYFDETDTNCGKLCSLDTVNGLKPYKIN